MELIELVSSHVTVPVIGVVLCALMVFTLGFRSPSVQPPSLAVEEKRFKKRSKQSKAKTSLNSHIGALGSSSQVLTKSTPESPKTGKSTLSSKLKPEIKKEVNEDVKGEKKSKVKKEVKADIKVQSLQGDVSSPLKKEAEQDGEWTTIQVSKKNKKQKPSKKDSGQQAEPDLQLSQNDPQATFLSQAAVLDVTVQPVTTISSAITDASPAITDASADIMDASADIIDTSTNIQPEAASSPMPDRVRNKTRKDGVTGENKAAERDHDGIEDIGGQSLLVQIQTPESYEPPVNKKKNKKDKKAAAGRASTSVSSLDDAQTPAAPAATLTTAAVAATVTTTAATVTTAAAAVGQKVTGPAVALLESPHLDQSSSSQKMEACASSHTVQKDTLQTGLDMQIKQTGEAVKEDSKAGAAATASKLGHMGSHVPSADQHQQPPQPQTNPITARQPPVGISFDEIGDACLDAAPKTRKKKSRREN